MKLKLVFATATGIGLLMANGTYAGSDNSAITSQSGPGTVSSKNVISINQSAAHDSQVGGSPEDLWITQAGQFNNIMITQQDGFNTVGLSAPGVNQSNSGNTLTITQGPGYGIGHNIVGSVQQVDTVDNPATAYKNSASISQDWYETVGAVSQTYTSGAANSIGIVETGTTNQALNNNINTVTQNGGGNSTTLNFKNSGGAANGLGNFSTYSAAGVAAGSLNSLLNTYGLPLLYALVGVGNQNISVNWAVPQGTVTQIGQNNNVNVGANATGASFGFYQDDTSNYGTHAGNTIIGNIYGSGNAVVAAQPLTWGGQAYFSIAGQDNDVGLIQLGGADWADAITGGNNNHLAMLQIGYGGTNNATSTLDGNDNISVQLQAGVGGSNTSNVHVYGGANDNIVGTAQYSTGGGTNSAGVNVAGGSNNLAAVAQDATGGTNTANVSITGSNNNKFYTAGFSGVDSNAVAINTGTIGSHLSSGLQTALSSIPIVGSGILNANVLTPGLMTQVGGNSLGLTVVGDANLFSTYQNGYGNSISANIGNSAYSAGNNLAIAQVGSDNSATTYQNGSNNSIGVMQSSNYNVASISQ